ncbi:hypothetical protein CISG_09339 [Coccidioides immitis RMSCC 3703]|uniref:Uncharacterized protein n=2 Tax=Coccidioides immitis TaxID=5501 RepID=A0A0J8RDR0_COCIT|nr:hypothetical protein CIRG_04677 [Coccidioides immitis RMSCC 2394]KMU82028.1 hypothetical protein CISG_09339 [Coccidioides immitis RMSCC 3703]
MPECRASAVKTVGRAQGNFVVVVPGLEEHTSLIDVKGCRGWKPICRVIFVNLSQSWQPKPHCQSNNNNGSPSRLRTAAQVDGLHVDACGETVSRQVSVKVFPYFPTSRLSHRQAFEGSRNSRASGLTVHLGTAHTAAMSLSCSGTRKLVPQAKGAAEQRINTALGRTERPCIDLGAHPNALGWFDPEIFDEFHISAARPPFLVRQLCPAACSSIKKIHHFDPDVLAFAARPGTAPHRE